MDNIHAGWLTKSPRQRKTSTLWKLFRSVSRFLVSPVSLAAWFRFYAYMFLFLFLAPDC